MSVNHTPLEDIQPATPRCTRCQAELPRYATFCGHCGERVLGEKQGSSDGKSATSPLHADITDRYRITSLARRHAYAQLFFGIDNQQQRPVVIHDLDISSLDDQTRAHAIEAIQEEYDQLRTQSIPLLMPLIDLRYFDHHIYIIASTQQPTSKNKTQQFFTLQDVLQSGVGLPDEQIAIAWIYRLSRTMEHLHKNEIVPGNLDSQTIIVQEQNFTGEPLLVFSWLPELFYDLLPQSLNNINSLPFYSPEVISGQIEPRSDVYSLGALLYLLLTGSPPDDANTRLQRPMRTPREIDPEIEQDIESVVMQALSLEKTERFQSASEFAEALLQLFINPAEEQAGIPAAPSAKKTATSGPRATQKLMEKQPAPTAEINKSEPEVDKNTEGKNEQPSVSVQEDATVAIVPLQAQLARRYLSRIKTSQLNIQEIGEALVEEGSNTTQINKHVPAGEQGRNQQAEPSPKEQPPEKKAGASTSVEEQDTTRLSEHLMPEPKRKTEVIAAEHKADTEQDVTELPTRLVEREEIVQNLDTTHPASETETATNGAQNSKDLSLTRFKNILSGSLPTLPRPGHNKDQAGEVSKEKDSESFLQKFRRFILGEQQYMTSAAALIETPMRIQPNQSYSIRINVMGRNNNTTEQDHAAGLSALVEGDKLHVEVRSALYQNYAYVVQQADVHIPATGYVAEVIMPMQPLTSGPSGRRERLHIFFMDEARNPLYEKPFVIEVFISHLVQNGREGHNVLSIPL